MGCIFFPKGAIFTQQEANEGHEQQATNNMPRTTDKTNHVIRTAPYNKHHKLKVGKHAKIAYNRIGEMGTIAPHYL